MALVEWKDEYATGIDAIDAQHKRLFAMLNQLHESMKNHCSAETLGGLLDELVDYTQTHFTYEEQLMRDCGYSGYEAHKASHDDLVRKSLALRQELEAHSGSPSQQALMSMKVMDFLQDWLRHHILESDQRYVPTMTAPHAGV